MVNRVEPISRPICIVHLNFDEDAIVLHRTIPREEVFSFDCTELYVETLYAKLNGVLGIIKTITLEDGRVIDCVCN